MSTRYRATCDCGFTGIYASDPMAHRVLRVHSCARWEARAAAAERAAQRAAAVDRTPKPCHHKNTNHQHGTYPCYVLDACRCHPCTAANREYESHRTRQQAYGRWTGLVDAEPARLHVRRLMAAGMGIKRIVAASGTSTGVLWKLLYGCPRPDGTRRPPQRRLRPDTAQRILATELDLADGAFVPNTDTARRLQALVANGWSMSQLGARLGVDAGNFNPVINGTRRQVTAGTARAVHALYLELADQDPPLDTAPRRAAATRARNHARDNGWLPPLRIYGRLHAGPALPLPDLDDADVLDLPGPEYDEASVQRRMAGDRTALITKADRIEIVARARAAGWSLRDIEHRTGITKPERYLTPTRPTSTGDTAA